MTAVIGCVNGKGGPGKSTVAWNLATLEAALGRRVRLVDLDPQGTVSSWYAEREDKGTLSCEIAGLAGVDALLKRAVAAGEWDLIVLDTPGRLAELGPAIRACDVIVCPVQPTDADYKAFLRTRKAIDTEKRAERIYALPNRVKTPAHEDDVRAFLEPALRGKGRLASVSLKDWVKLQRTEGGLSIVDVARVSADERTALNTIAVEIKEMIRG